MQYSNLSILSPNSPNPKNGILNKTGKYMVQLTGPGEQDQFEAFDDMPLRNFVGDIYLHVEMIYISSSSGYTLLYLL